MSGENIPLHFVCTREEARRLVREHDRFWVCNCGCREGRGICRRSRIDVCLMFADAAGSSGSNKHEITPAEVESIFDEAKDKHLVTRPFRGEIDRSVVEGICFCCDDCCGYFQNSDEVCDKGKLIEQTEMSDCTHCGICVEVCYFGARKMNKSHLNIDREKCFGCGLCVEICPEECIFMVPRL